MIVEASPLQRSDNGLIALGAGPAFARSSEMTLHSRMSAAAGHH